MGAPGSLAASTEITDLVGAALGTPRMSATILGGRLGLSAREMNVLLHELGFLFGKPGAWGLTDKGKAFGLELDHTNGYGGWAERWWSTTSWDPKILDTVHDELAERGTNALTLVRDAVARTAPNGAPAPTPINNPVAASNTRGNVLIIVGTLVVVAAATVAYPRLKRWVGGGRNRHSGGQATDDPRE